MIQESNHFVDFFHVAAPTTWKGFAIESLSRALFSKED